MGKNEMGEEAYPPPPSAYQVPPAGYSQPQFNQQYGQPTVLMEAKKKADLALVLSIVGLFFFSLILGFVSLYLVKQSEDMGGEAKGAKILGWIDVGIGVLSIVLTFFIFLLGISSY
ncbi:MAG: DUF4190 domain-containing protein [Enterococcus sp.]|nr:DUF4190 domain-containing protein [Enterococcus sp.]